MKRTLAKGRLVIQPRWFPPVIGLLGACVIGASGCRTPPPAAAAAGAPAAPERGYALMAEAAARPKPSPTPRPAQATITVDAALVRHAASPYTIGFNRNHSHRQFATNSAADRQAMIAATRALVPRWGQAYLGELLTAGYPAPTTPAPIMRTGHGPTDGRTDYATMQGYFFEQMWGLDGQAATWDGYPYDDLRYVLDEAEEIGAEPLVTVNFGTGTAASAGQLAEYLNAGASALRDAHPFTEPPFAMASDQPRRAFLFEIGNEVQLRQMRGHDKANSIDEYVANARAYVEAIRQASPHPVKIGLSSATNIFFGGPNTGEDSWLQRGAMISGFIQAAQSHEVTFDALVCHLYPLYPVREQLAGIAYAEGLFNERLIPAMGSADFEFWNDEFHAASGSTIRNPGMYGALYAADATVMAFGLSRAGKQLIPVGADFAWWHGGAGNGYDSLYFQGNSAANLTPIYHFRRLLATHWGDHVVATSTTGGGAWTDAAADGTTTVVSNLHAVAARSADGLALHVLVVNRSRATETANLKVQGFAPQRCRLSRIAPTTADPWGAAWNEVQVKEGQALKLGAPITFPAGSISFVTFR